MERVVAGLTQAQTRQRAQQALAARNQEEGQWTAYLAQLTASLEQARATLPEQDQLTRQIAALEAMQPDYDALEQKRRSLKEKEQTLAAAKTPSRAGSSTGPPWPGSWRP